MSLLCLFVVYDKLMIDDPDGAEGNAFDSGIFNKLKKEVFYEIESKGRSTCDGSNGYGSRIFHDGICRSILQRLVLQYL